METSASTMMTAITSGITQFVTIIGTSVTALTGNELTAMYLGMGVFMAGLGGFVAMKHAARR